MYLYECDVYNKAIGCDTYLVEADNEEEAIANLEARLENENPYPLMSWVILMITRKD
jgi:hypothetical protein